MSGNHFLKTEIHFLVNGNHFLLLPQIFFNKLFIPASVNTFFSPEEKVLFFTQSFFYASGNHYLDYRKAYLKLLSLLLATIVFDFSDISANVSSFFVQQKRILKQILHSCQCKPIFCLVETVFLYLNIFFLLVEIQFLKNNLIPASGS